MVPSSCALHVWGIIDQAYIRERFNVTACILKLGTAHALTELNVTSNTNLRQVLKTEVTGFCMSRLNSHVFV